MYIAIEVEQSNGFDSKALAIDTDLKTLKKFVENYVFESSDSCHERKTTEGWEWVTQDGVGGIVYVNWEMDPGYSYGILIQEAQTLEEMKDK